MSKPVKFIQGTARILPPDVIELADEHGAESLSEENIDFDSLSSTPPPVASPEPTPAALPLALLNAPEFDEAQLSRGDIKAVFDPLHGQMESLRDRCMALKVNNESQIEKMKEARQLRLIVRAIRITAKKYHDPMVADYVKRKSAVDTAERLIRIACEPIETHLEEQEKFVERQQAERRNEMLRAREAQLVALGVDPLIYVLDKFTPEEWDVHIGKLQEDFDRREYEAAEAERNRLEKIESDRIAAEELRQHAIEQTQRANAAEAEAKRIRDEADKEARRIREEARIAEEAAQEQRNRERRDFQAKEDAERVKAVEAQRAAVAAANAKAEKAKKAAEEKARKEREAAAQKAADDRAALQAQIEAEKRRNAAMIEVWPVVLKALDTIACGGDPSASLARNTLETLREKGVIESQ